MGHGNEQFKECTGEDASMSCPCPLDTPGVQVKIVIPNGPLASRISLPESILYPERVLGSPVWGKAEAPGSSHPLSESQAMRGIDSIVDNDPSFLTFGWHNSELFLRGLPTRLVPVTPRQNPCLMPPKWFAPFPVSLSHSVYFLGSPPRRTSYTQIPDSVYFRGNSG